jgi:hypothetical protein
VPQALGNAVPHINWLNRLFWSAATTYNLNLIADGYRHIDGYYPRPIPAGEELTLREVIDRYFRSHTHVAQEGAFYTVRRHRWYTTRLTEIPERLVDEWIDRLRGRDALDLEDQATVAITLRDEQLPNAFTMLRDRGLRFPEGVGGLFGYSGGRKGYRTAGILRTYALLPVWQKERLRTGQPVPYSSMPPEARRWLQWMLRRGASENRKPLPEEVEAGMLRLAIRNVRRTVTPVNGGTEVKYHYQDALSPDLAGVGFRNSSDRLAGGTTTYGEVRPTGGGESMQQAYFLYAYGRGQAAHVPILPLRIELRIPPKPNAPVPNGMPVAVPK